MKQTNIYAKILLNLLFAAATLFFIIYVFPRAIGFFLPFVIGWIISLIANPIVKFLERRIKIGRKQWSAIFIVVVLAALIAIIYFTISSLSRQIASLLTDLPSLYIEIEKQVNVAGNNLMGIYNLLPEGLQNIVLNIGNGLGDYMDKTITDIGKASFNAGTLTKNLADGLIMFILTMLSAYFFIADRERIIAAISKITPEHIKEKFNFIMDSFKTAVWGYFKAQFKILFIIIIIVCAGLSILGVNYAFLVGFLIALLDFLPFFGTGTILCPWAVIELFSGNTSKAIGLFIVYLVSQVVRQVIQPKILGDSMGLDPLSTLIFMYIGLKLKGILGMILGIPIGIILINLYKAGTFDKVINNTKKIFHQLNEMRKL